MKINKVILSVLMLGLMAIGSKATPGHRINSDASAKQAVQQYAENNFEFGAVVYQAALDKNLWRLTLAAHAYLQQKPTDPARECSFAQAYWQSQQFGTSENVPASQKQILRGLYTEAVMDTQDAVRRLPNLAESHLMYGHFLQYYMLMDKSNIPKMLHEYKEAVRLEPGSGYNHYQLALGYMGSDDLSINTINKIIAESKKAVALDPRLTRSYFLISNTYDWPGHRDYKQFKLYLDKYLKAHPEDANDPHITAW